MKKLSKKIVSILSAATIAVGSIASMGAFAYSPTSSEYDVRVYVDGVNIYENSSGYEQPFVMDGYDRTMVPLRPIFETLGGSATWDAETRTATCTNNMNNVRYRFTVDSFNLETITSDGTVSETTTFDAPSVLVGDHIYIPIRAFCEAAGFTIAWDGATNSVYINDPRTESGSTTVTVEQPEPVTESSESDILTYEEALALAEQYIADDNILLSGSETPEEYNGRPTYQFRAYSKTLVENGGSGFLGVTVCVYADNGEIEYIYN